MSIDIVTSAGAARWGDKYADEYVHKLYAAVKRNSTFAYRFVVLTDDFTAPDITSIPLDPLEGWWNKMSIFNPGKHLAKTVIWIDLDTVITGNIDFLAEYEGSLAMLDDFYWEEKPAGGLMITLSHTTEYIWRMFNSDKEKYYPTGGDMQAIDVITRNVDRLPDRIQQMWPRKVASYKCHCDHGVPDDVRIVCFHGEPRPHQVRDLDWMKEHWR